jgi:hypothetical protein
MTNPVPPPNAIEPKVIYEQLCNDFRSLNGFLWQTPLIIMTLTGGLWFAVASFELTATARSNLLVFATFANLIMIAALYRLRYVMQRIQNEIRRHDGRPVIGPNYFIVTCFALLLLAAAIGSWCASRSPEIYFNKGTAEGTLEQRK